MLALSGLAIGGIVVGSILLVLVFLVAMRSKGQMAPGQKSEPPHDAPPAVDVGMMTPAPTHTSEPEIAPVTEAAKPKVEEARPADPPKADKPATLEVEALSPSMTDTMPALSAEADEMKMGTDELPKFGTAEMPRVGTAEVPKLDDGPVKYRTAPANELAEAITSGTCPKCNAPTFVGDVASDDGTMYTLNGRCGACGHKAQVIDMRLS
ncbi:MAG: hypothetical protein KDB90_05190 [Planctomycetes bacterium]|nr:hypothetical protein [Planctomycetota bacterium]